MPALARAARRLGAAIVEGCAVRTVETEAGRVRAVHTERGRIGAQAVVLAGGAWTSYFASNLGLDLPQLTVRATAGRTNPVAGPEMPAVYSPQLCIRRRADGGYTVANGDLVEHYGRAAVVPLPHEVPVPARGERPGPSPPSRPAARIPGELGGQAALDGGRGHPLREDPGAESAAFGDRPAADFRPASRPGPRLAEAGMAEFWGGMIDVTPDAVPYICEAPAPRGLFVGTGMSGHGFGIGPGVGRVLADLVLGRPHGHDLERFRFERFTDGSAIVPGPY